MYTMSTTKEENLRQFAKDSPCICFNVRKASKIITSIYEKMFKPVGLTAPQGVLLASVRELGPLTVNQLAEAVATDRTTLTRNLKILKRDGLISLSPGEDKRIKKIAITEEGLVKSNQCSALFKEFRLKIDRTVGKARVDTLCQELYEVIEIIKTSEQ